MTRQRVAPRVDAGESAADRRVEGAGHAIAGLERVLLGSFPPASIEQIPGALVIAIKATRPAMPFALKATVPAVASRGASDCPRIEPVEVADPTVGPPPPQERTATIRLADIRRMKLLPSYPDPGRRFLSRSGAAG